MENNDNPVPDFLAPPSDPQPAPTKEQAREVAQKAVEAAQQALTDVKKSIEEAQKAKAAAQVIIDKAKPSIQRAEARVMLAKADLAEFGALPKEKTEDNPSILEAVKKVLGESPKQMTTLEISEALKADGVDNNPDNLNAYLTRWAKTGVIVKAEKANKFEPARYYMPPVPNGVPGFLAAPGAQTPPPQAPADTEFPEDFPGRVPLMEAGITSPADLAGKTEADLLAIPGIGKGTAGKILAAV